MAGAVVMTGGLALLGTISRHTASRWSASTWRFSASASARPCRTSCSPCRTPWPADLGAATSVITFFRCSAAPSAFRARCAAESSGHGRCRLRAEPAGGPRVRDAASGGIPDLQPCRRRFARWWRTPTGWPRAHIFGRRPVRPARAVRDHRRGTRCRCGAPSSSSRRGPSRGGAQTRTVDAVRRGGAGARGAAAAGPRLEPRLATEVHPDLQPAAYALLSRVDELGSLRASDLSDYFGIDKGAVSRQVALLERVGLVRREPDPRRRPGPAAGRDRRGTRRMTRAREGRRRLLREQLDRWPRPTSPPSRAAGPAQPADGRGPRAAD